MRLCHSGDAPPAGSGFFLLLFRSVLPSAVQPPVLTWVCADEILNCLSVFRGNPFDRVVSVGPFLGENNAVDPDFKVETISNPSAVTDTDGQIMRDGQQCDTFVSTCGPAEEIDEYAFSSGVLVGYKTYCGATGGD